MDRSPVFLPRSIRVQGFFRVYRDGRQPSVFFHRSIRLQGFFRFYRDGPQPRVK